MFDKFSTEKKKQFFFTGALVLGSTAAIFLLSSVFSSDKPKVNTIETPNVRILDKKDLDNKVFRHEAGLNDAKVNAELASVKKELEEIKNGRNPAMQQNGFGQQSAPLPPMSQLPQVTAAPPAPAPAPPTNVSPSNPPEVPTKKEAPRSVVMQDMIVSVSSGNSTDATASGPASNEPTKTKPKQKKIEIPSGSFMQGVLLSGIDAPTGTKGKSSPHPVLIQIVESTNLANGFRADLKGCRVIGSAYGDLSSERAYIRVEKLSCVAKDGRVVEKSKGASFGYVTAEDGKAGLLGRVVTKQGTILARALMTGFVDGVAKGFQQSSMNYSIQPTGSVGIPDPNMLAQQGIGSGVSEASKKLADFYMKLANEMFPVIEINAGRKVDVVLLEKITFDTDGEEK